MTHLKAGSFSVDVDDRGSFLEISMGDVRFPSAPGYPLFEIDKEPADLAEGRAAGCFTAGEGAGRGILCLSAKDELLARFTPDPEGSAQTVGLVFSFPETAEIHIPKDYNLAHRIDRQMPRGEQFSTSLGYNFFLVRSGEMWFRFMARQPGRNQRRKIAWASVSRHPGLFLVTFTWKPADEAAMSVFPSMQAAIQDYQQWLEREVGLVKLASRPNLPKWVHAVPLVLIIDMMRSDGEISHDYADITRLAGELRRIGCPRDTLFYLPGWNGEYDGLYPTYRPCGELGGDAGFKAMIDALHHAGFRVMLHTNPWGVDPSHPQLDSYRKLLVKDRDGKYAGFQTASYTKWGHIAPTRRLLKFRTGRIPIGAPASGNGLRFQTVAVPDQCEALVTLGGLPSGDYRISATIGRRTLVSEEGALRETQEYAFPFTFLLLPGANAVRLEVSGSPAPDLSRCWYRIERCFMPPDPYGTWSHPILFADTANPEWVSIFVGNVARVVKEYGIDAIHCDATDYESNAGMYTELAKALPDVAKAGEGFEALAALGYWSFCQMDGGQSLLGYLDIMRGTRQQCSIPDVGRLEELYSWLDQPSAAISFVKDYVRFYPHLCAADAFVPTGKVCNTSPKMQSPRSRESLWKVIHDVPRLDYLPALRLNYRDYGLDRDTRKAIRWLTRSRPGAAR